MSKDLISQEDISLIKEIRRINNQRLSIYKTQSRKRTKLCKAILKLQDLDYETAFRIAREVYPTPRSRLLATLIKKKSKLVKKLSRSLRSKGLRLNHDDSGFFYSISNSQATKNIIKLQEHHLALSPNSPLFHIQSQIVQAKIDKLARDNPHTFIKHLLKG